jgi:hypothetical protein
VVTRSFVFEYLAHITDGRRAEKAETLKLNSLSVEGNDREITKEQLIYK